MTMDLKYVILMQAVENMQPISNSMTRQEVDEYRATFVYPVGMFPSSVMENNNLYIMAKQEDLLQYLNTQLTYLYTGYYTEDEINILTYYFYYVAKRNSFLQKNKLPITSEVEDLIQTRTTKEEITYVIQDLEYALLQEYLLEENRNEEIQALIEDLAPVEEWHNKFNINVKYTI